MSAQAGVEGDGARSIEIAPGVWLPRLGLGVWEVDPGGAGERIIAGALEAGYRHIDTAQGYENERAVGAGIRASGVAARRDLRHHEVLPRTRRRRARGRAQPREARARPHGPVPGARPASRSDLGVAGDGARPRSRSRAGDRRQQLRGARPRRGARDRNRPAGGRPAAAQPVRVQAAPRRGVPGPRHRDRGLQPPDAWPRPRRPGARRRRRAGGADALPGHASLGPPEGASSSSRSRTTCERQIENAAIFDFTLSAADVAELDALDRTGGSGRAHETPWW